MLYFQSEVVPDTMDQCPHCESSVTDGSKCPNCGQSLDSLPEYQSETVRHGTVQPAQPNSTPTTEPPDREAKQSESDDGPQGDDSADASETVDGLQKISRRTLLGGAGASVALLGVGGAGWMYLQGSGVGDDIVRSYVDAMAANSWSQSENLYHEDAPVISRIKDSVAFDDYEGYLASQDVLETWENLDPKLDGIQEFYHATEVTEESIEELNIRLESYAIEMIDEVRSAIAFLAVKVGEPNENQENAGEYYKDGRENRPLTCDLVLIDGEWFLWRVRGLGRFE